jgi:superfamily II DNA or RNA helicase
MMTNAERNRVALGLARGEIEQGEQVVILSHRRDHCRRFDADLAAFGVTSGLLLGGAESEAEFARTLDGIMRGDVRAAAGTYQAIGQGLDLPSVAVGIAATPIANDAGGRSFFGQVRGRLCRVAEGKIDARIYYLWDRALYGVRPIRNLCRWNNRVVVLEGGQWIEGRTFVRRFETEVNDAKAE